MVGGHLAVMPVSNLLCMPKPSLDSVREDPSPTSNCLGNGGTAHSKPTVNPALSPLDQPIVLFGGSQSGNWLINTAMTER